MQREQATFQEIPSELLVEHPENSNFMSADKLKKTAEAYRANGQV